MESEINKLQKLADKVVDGIESVVPVIGNLLYNYEDDGSVLYANFSSFFDKQINDTVRDEDRSIIILDSVLNFLVKGNFKLILTTSPFDTLDNALKGRGVHVKSYYHRWGQQDSTNEIQRRNGEWSQNDCIKDGIIGIKDTLVYHLLGGYTDSTTNKPKNQNEFLDCLLSYQKEKSNSMQKMLSQKQILLLGSGIPNWLFLLLWYPLMKDSGIKHLFNYNCENNPEFQTCIDSLSFKTKPAMDKFLEFAITKMTTETQSNLLQQEFKYDIFLSYKTEDKPFADKVYNYLREKHKDVEIWYIDVRKDKDNPGEYYNRILDGIMNSRTFMPVIGKNYSTTFQLFERENVAATNKPLNDNLEAIIKKDLGLLTETFMALKKKDIIKASTGLDFYVIPVWDMDTLDTQERKLLKLTFNNLNIFQEIINEYSYTDDNNKVIGGLKPFKSIVWSDLFKK